MKKVVRMVSLLMVALMLFTAGLTGCGTPAQSNQPATSSEPAASTAAPASSEETAATEPLKEVELSMYLLGDPAKDEDLMLAELNKLIKKDLNATLKISWISWGDWQNKYPLVLASGEPIDLIFTANWSFFANSAAKSAFLALDELLPQYAPKSWAEYPKQAWLDATINGKIYALPMNLDEINPWGFVVRGDLRQKYGVPEIKTLEDFGVYLDAIKTNEKGMIPYNAGQFELSVLPFFYGINALNSTQVTPNIAGIFSDNSDSQAKTYILADDPRYEEFLKLMRTWYQKGYWSKSVLQNKVNASDSFIIGKSGGYIANGVAQSYSQVKKDHPDWIVEYFEAYPQHPKQINSYMNNAMAIPVSAKNPERAVMLLEKFHQDEVYFNLIEYGIEGRNYIINSEGKLDLPAGVNPADNGYPASGPCPWGFNDKKFWRASVNDSPQFEAVKKDMVSKAIVFPLYGFNFVQDAVKSEFAACQGLDAQYGQPLTWGLVDPAKILPEFRQKLHDAGIDKVKEEVDRQIPEFLKSRNK